MKTQNVPIIREIKLPEPSGFQNTKFYLAGLAMFVITRARHALRGYRNPRPFSIDDLARAVAYDFNVVNNWMETLGGYTGNSSLEGKRILELGPGADLGVGLITLMKGAAGYNAMDINNLVASVPDGFYDALFGRMSKDCGVNAERLRELREQLELTRKGKNDRLNYVCRKDFDITQFKDAGVDIVFSQAAFEHFSDVGGAVKRLSRVVKKGAVIVAEIDLKTHSRWLRDADPLNIYRYGGFVYDVFSFPATPNRLRPRDYAGIFEANGWGDVRIIPLVRLDAGYADKISPSLDARFRDAGNQMDYLSVIFCATKK